MKFAIIGILVVLSLAFIVLLWKAAKAWRWYHLVGSLFTFGLAIAFIFPTAGVLKSRQAWHNKKEELEERAKTAKAENYYIRYGDPDEENGATHLALKLAKLGRETGRLWRDLQIQRGSNAQSLVLQPVAPQQAAPDGVPVADPAGDAAAAPPTQRFPVQNSVVYAFIEANINNMRLPVFFLGEFQVAQTGDTQLTIAPTGKLRQDQQQRLGQILAGRATLSLYELLPLDGHEPFIAEGSKESADNIFGRVDDTLVKSLLQNKVPEETLQQYLRDGGRWTEEEGRWVKIEFLANYEVDVDSPTQAEALEGGYFDSSGRSVDARLQRGGRVAFKKEQQIIVKDEAAKLLVDTEKVAKLIDTYYVRPLNDYRFSLRRLRLRLAEAAIRKTELEYEWQVLEDSRVATVSMLTSNQTAKLKLEQDLAQIQTERKALSQYEASVSGDVKRTQQRLVNLYQENIRLEAELKRLYGGN